MRRREFVILFGGTAAAWPSPARAQSPQRVRRIGVLWPYTEADPDSHSRIASLRQALRDLGWSEGRNLRFDYRWAASADNPDRIRRYATELVALAPDLIVAGYGGFTVLVLPLRGNEPQILSCSHLPLGVHPRQSV